MRYLLILLLFACNPVKQVLKDPKKFDQVKDAVIRSGACVNDTLTVEITKDTVIYKDSLIEKMIKVPCKDFDTTFGDTRISVSSGVLKYEHKCKEKAKWVEKKVTNTVRDRALENILKGDIERLQKDSANKVLELRKVSQSLSEAKWNNKMLWLKLIGLVVLFGVITFRKQLIGLILKK